MRSGWSLLRVTLCLTSATTLARAEGVWLTSACYTFRLTVWDKLDDKQFKAKYTVTSGHGHAFVAEKTAADSNSSEVIFPDDFKDSKGLQAWVDCKEGERYLWRIYSNGVLRDSGTISFSRGSRK